MINFKFPLQPQQKYYITQYDIPNSSKMIILPTTSVIHSFLKGWENVLFEPETTSILQLDIKIVANLCSAHDFPLLKDLNFTFSVLSDRCQHDEPRTFNQNLHRAGSQAMLVDQHALVNALVVPLNRIHRQRVGLVVGGLCEARLFSDQLVVFEPLDVRHGLRASGDPQRCVISHARFYFFQGGGDGWFGASRSATFP